MLNIGLTGVMCSGKSTALKYFKECGAKVIDSDQIVKKLFQPGEKEHSKIIRYFGSEITKGKTIDRKRLRDLVMKNRKNLLALEKILHPGVRRVIRQKKRDLKNKKGLFVCEVPLLFENGFDKEMDLNVVVSASIAFRKKLAKKRGIPWSFIESMSKRQWALERKIKKADFVIVNNGNLNHLKKKVKILSTCLIKT